MKSKTRSLILTIAIAIMVGCCLGGSVYAFLSASDTADNPISVGENTIEVGEEFDPPEELTPGSQYTKAPQINNIGNMDCYARMSVYFSNDAASEFTSIDFDTVNWYYNAADEYYYYRHVIKAGESSTPLFTTVTTLSEIDNGDGTTTPITKADLIDYEIIIYAESVQAANHKDFWDAWAAFGIVVSKPDRK